MLKKVLVIFIFAVLAILGISYFGLLSNKDKIPSLNWYKKSKKDYGIQQVKYKQKKYPEANNCILSNKKLFEE